MAYDKRKAVAALAAFQESTGLKDHPWEVASKVGEGTLRKFRDGAGRSMSGETYEKLAAGATKKLGRDFTAAHIRGEVPMDIMLPVASFVSAGDEAAFPVDGDPPFDWEKAPPGMKEGEVLEVRGRSMLPVFKSGDRLFHTFLTLDFKRLYGELVIAKLKDGRRFVKVLEPGSKRNRYTLSSFNPAYSPLEDQELAAVAEIVWVKRSGTTAA